jgi:crossover junction endodeoxyribonuclease RuvC
MEFPQRLGLIYEDMTELLKMLEPDAVSVEELFFNTNITTGIQVAHGRGVILLACQRFGVPIYEYTPLQVKQAVAGYGRAEKRQVMEMTKRLLHLKAIPKPDDAADGLALALCHARSSTSLMAGLQK